MAGDHARPYQDAKQDQNAAHGGTRGAIRGVAQDGAPDVTEGGIHSGVRDATHSATRGATRNATRDASRGVMQDSAQDGAEEPGWAPDRQADVAPGRERGSAAAEFSLLATPAVLVTLLVAQLALLLYQRNVVMTALAEGARVAATAGRDAADGRAAACALLAATIGDRCDTLHVTATEDGPLVTLRARGTLPSVVSGLGLRVRMTAQMHDEDDLLSRRVSGWPSDGATRQGDAQGGAP